MPAPKLPQGGPEVVDLLADLLDHGPHIGLQVLALGPADVLGADPRLAQLRPQVLQLGISASDLTNRHSPR
jgi:hypothetical protein